MDTPPNLQAELKPYFDRFRFYPDKKSASISVEKAIAGAHRVYDRPALIFDDVTAIRALKNAGIHHFQTAPDYKKEIISPSLHMFIPAHSTRPVVVCFKFHSEHNGKAPCADADCIIQPLHRWPVTIKARG